MPGPNVLDLVADIREAVERLPREALADILVYVFKEYVVQGPAPLATSAAPASDDLAGMSFGEVIRSLQLRLDLPELELFSVEESGRVTVRSGGRAVAVEAAASRPEPLPVPPQPTPAPPVVPRRAGATSTQAAPAASQQASAGAPQQGAVASPPGGRASGPAPSGDVAATGTATGGSAQPGGAASQQGPAPVAPDKGAPAVPGKGSGGGLLEID